LSKLRSRFWLKVQDMVRKRKAEVACRFYAKYGSCNDRLVSLIEQKLPRAAILNISSFIITHVIGWQQVRHGRRSKRPDRAYFDLYVFRSASGGCIFWQHVRLVGSTGCQVRTVYIACTMASHIATRVSFVSRVQQPRLDAKCRRPTPPSLPETATSHDSKSSTGGRLALQLRCRRRRSGLCTYCFTERSGKSSHRLIHLPFPCVCGFVRPQRKANKTEK
jgi:hypothetical protein